MKVLHVSSEKGWRGGEQQVSYLVEEQVRNGDISVFIAARTNSALESFCKKKNLACFSFQSIGSLSISTAWALKSICETSQIDIIHAHTPKAHTVAVLSALLGNARPIIVSRRVVFQPKNSALTKWKYNHSSIKRVICISEKVREVMTDYLKDPQKAVTVYSGIDVNKFKNHHTPAVDLRKQYSLPDDAKIIANTSALEEEKDYFTFLKVITKLAHEKPSLYGMIIGKGSLEIALKNFASTLGIEHRVIFTGFRNDLVTILPQVDLFLMTSRQEGLGTSILDAFAARVPVVATEAGGIPEMVVHEQTGMLGKIGDADSLSNSCERIINDESFRTKIIHAAAMKLNSFSKEEMARKTSEVYKNVLAEVNS